MIYSTKLFYVRQRYLMILIAIEKKLLAGKTIKKYNNPKYPIIREYKDFFL